MVSFCLSHHLVSCNWNCGKNEVCVVYNGSWHPETCRDLGCFLRPAGRWSCLTGAQSSKMVIKNQITVVCFGSGPSSALSPCLSWVKTLEQIRDIYSKHAIALPHSLQGTTRRDVFLPQCGLRILTHGSWLSLLCLKWAHLMKSLPWGFGAVPSFCSVVSMSVEGVVQRISSVGVHLTTRTHQSDL